MSDQLQPEKNDTSKKKLSLQEAIKQQLENKKNKSGTNQSYANASTATKKLTSQRTKKANNQSRRTGV